MSCFFSYTTGHEETRQDKCKIQEEAEEEEEFDRNLGKQSRNRWHMCKIVYFAVFYQYHNMYIT